MKIASINDYYNHITEINETSELKLEIHEGRPFIIVDDFLKRPDEFREFLEKYPHWENKIDDTGFSRPGRSALIPLIAGKFIANYLSPYFGLDSFGIHSVYTNCMNGNMKVCERSKLPHTDGIGLNFLATNIFLSKTCEGGTGFWSYDNGHSENPYISMHHLNSFDQKECIKKTESKILTDWEQYDSIDVWKLDYVLPQKYNRFFVYSGSLFHNPYIKPNTYIDEDRFSFVTMLNASESYNLIDSNPQIQEQYEKLRDIFYLTIPNLR